VTADLTCRELVEFLDDYLEGRLAGEALCAFQEHLAACPSCVAYMKTYRTSERMARAVLRDRDDLPPDVPPGLVEAILAARPPW
jgi:predicted anti-sigma-YlaC factor YlaD